MTDHDKDQDLNESPTSADTSVTDEIDWDAAMAEQMAGHAEDEDKSTQTQADGLAGGLDDDWAAALAEQTAATAPAEASATAEASAATEATKQASAAGQDVFRPLQQASGEHSSDIDMIMDIPVQLSVELGRTRLTIKNILQLGQGSVVELDGLAGEPMDIFVNGYLIAQGEVVVVDDKYGIRVTDIVTPSDRIQRLNTRRQ